ncbi:hypothetical protein SBA4_2470038 [Candidatus Sulfopaludibacter sp. SbA4]|nr:hypothetical protein SBA4_2470038 [Candidatus Sulfopaludibacter sp. SbA4]
MSALLALADDLTGALEVGAKFAGRGIPSLVTTSSHPTAHPVEVIDIESRHLSQEASATAVTAFADTPARIIYLKTDSTLRGNIAAELQALARARPESTIAYMPAYPALGRTVKDGVLYVYGIPVHRTAFAADPLDPVTDSSIRRLVRDVSRCTVHDGETDADVARATAAALADPHCRIIAGPASVAAEIAAQFAQPRAPAPTHWPRIRKCLIVNGSLHEVSVGQMAFAEAHGCLSTSATAGWRILHLPIPAATRPLEIAAATGRLVLQCLSETELDAVMVFGGDTAFGILKALGCPPLEPIGEVVTGVPVSRVLNRNLYFITKAGGFGDESLIPAAKQLLHAND